MTVWKCQDCGYKLQKTHAAGSPVQKVTFLKKENLSNSQEMSVHQWNDKKHNLTKPKRKKDDTPLHTSVQAIFAYYEKTGKSPQANMTKADLPLVLPRQVTPRELINVLKKDFPELY